MFNKIVNSLKDIPEFQNAKTNFEMVEDFANMLSSKSSCSEPSLQRTKIQNPFLEKVVKTIVTKRNKYYEENLRKSTELFSRFKEEVFELSKTDPGLKESLDIMLSQTNSAVKALVDPREICEKFINYYKLKMSSVFIDSTPEISKKQIQDTINQFTEVSELIVKCMKAILDNSGRSAIIESEELEKVGDLYHKETSVTEKDFNKCEMLKDYFKNFKLISDIFIKVNIRSRKILAPVIREIYGHLVCAIFVANRYIVCFPDAPGKIFNFGVFMTGVKPYSSLLMPFNFDKNMAMIMISDIETDE